MGGAYHGALVLDEADQRHPGRQPAHESPGSVDRVEYPDAARARWPGAVFLTEYPIVGIGRFDQRAQRPLRRPVGFGDRVEAAFELVVDARQVAEIGQDRRAGGRAEREGEAVELGCVGALRHRPGP